jgi:hypothetical protein
VALFLESVWNVGPCTWPRRQGLTPRRTPQRRTYTAWPREERRTYTAWPREGRWTMADAMRAQLEAMQVEQGRSEQGMPSAEAIEEPSTPSAFEEGGVEEVDVRGAAAKREATLEECVSLLRAPKDEQRFVGLLLVTRFLQVCRARRRSIVHPSPPNSSASYCRTAVAATLRV